jgi:hypothetical protein
MLPVPYYYETFHTQLLSDLTCPVGTSRTASRIRGTVPVAAFPPRRWKSRPLVSRTHDRAFPRTLHWQLLWQGLRLTSWQFNVGAYVAATDWQSSTCVRIDSGRRARAAIIGAAGGLSGGHPALLYQQEVRLSGY